MNNTIRISSMSNKNFPVARELYENIRSGKVYEIICISNTKSTRTDFPVTVVYVGVGDGDVWSRPLGEFLNRVKRYNKSYIGNRND